MSISKIISTLGKAGAKIHPKNMFPMRNSDAEALMWMGVFGAVGLIAGCESCISSSNTGAQQKHQQHKKEIESEKDNLNTVA